MIQQVNIIVEEQDRVNGYDNISATQIAQLTNSYVINIICNCIDKLPQQERDPFFATVLKKIHPGGSITLRFINPTLIANKIKNGSASGSSFASMISSIKSSWTESDFLSILSQLNGYKMIKFYNEDIHSVAVITKNK